MIGINTLYRGIRGLSNWSISDSKKLYNIDGPLKSSFFDVDEKGYLVLKIDGEKIRVYDLLTKYQLDGAYIRVLPWIKKLMDRVYETYMFAFKKYGYRGDFQPVYPLKANSDPRVVDTIYRYGSRYKWGFNLNTLPEAKLVSRYVDGEPRTIVVDGVKSEKILSVLEKLWSREWLVIVDIEHEKDAELLEKYEFPVGLRLKYLSSGEGPWKESAGLDSKFGLSLLKLEKLLENHPWIYDRAILLHTHPGSQVYRLDVIRKYFIESVNIYNELKRQGFKKIKYIDFGGGLPYPYHESRLGWIESPDYGLEEYVYEMVSILASKTNDHPTIVFENGRYLVALHRIVVARVVEVAPYDVYVDENSLNNKLASIREVADLSTLEKWLKNTLEFINNGSSKTTYSFRDRRIVEREYGILNKLVPYKVYEMIKDNPQELNRVLNEYPLVTRYLLKPSHRFYTVFSIFAHIPDKVVVNQYFQVVPIQRLDEKPEVITVLSDLTCDSMGEYGDFISTPMFSNEKLFTQYDKKPLAIPGKPIKLKGIPLHLPRGNEKYYVAFLDTGAYQDNLASNHNSLGDFDEIVLDQIDDKLIIEHISRSSETYKY